MLDQLQIRGPVLFQLLKGSEKGHMGELQCAFAAQASHDGFGPPWHILAGRNRRPQSIMDSPANVALSLVSRASIMRFFGYSFCYKNFGEIYNAFCFCLADVLLPLLQRSI